VTLYLVETDVILAAASSRDRHHDVALKVLQRAKPLLLSPFSLIELDLLVSSGRIQAVLPGFYRALEGLLMYYGIDVPPPQPLHLERASELRPKYGLSYFDSLHAAVAVSAGATLISFDRRYANVEGLAYIHPREFLESLKGP
jgi:predicted nucleic acid-binding protein